MEIKHENGIHQAESEKQNLQGWREADDENGQLLWRRKTTGKEFHVLEDEQEARRLIQIVGHGELSALVTDDYPTIRLKDWAWQISEPRYGKRTDITVWNTVNKIPGYIDSDTEVWVCRSELATGGRVDISQYGGLSTGHTAIIAAWERFGDELLLHGFTSLQNGKDMKRINKSPKDQGNPTTVQNNWVEQKKHLEFLGVRFTFA